MDRQRNKRECPVVPRDGLRAASYNSVSERLDIRHSGIRAIHKPRARAGIQRDVRGNHVESVGEAEAVDESPQISIDVVDVDGAAGRGLAGIRLRDEEQFVDGIKLNVGPAEELRIG